jgi:pyrroline-5-carboxylate reductase
MSSSNILCVGIGNMGGALAQALFRSGRDHKISIWNRSSDRPQVKALIDLGANFEPDLGAAIANNDIILVCLLDYPSVFSVLSPQSLALNGKVVINLTNGTPRESIEAQAWMTARGVARYFDGAVMVTPQLVGTPQSFLIFSGETEAIFQSAISDLVSPLGAAVYIGEDVSAAATNDLAALAAMYGMFSGAFIALGLYKRRLARSGGSGGGIAPSVEKVVAPLLTALVPYVTLIAKAVDEEAWDDSQGNPLAMQLTAVRNILQACKEEGVSGAPLEPLAAMMQRIVDERGGDGGVAEVARLMLE